MNILLKMFAVSIIICFATMASAHAEWVIDTVDVTGQIGGSTSIDIDSQGYVHIAYFDPYNRDLFYATNSTGVWVTEIVDTNVYHYSVSIAIDSKDRVHIGYRDRNAYVKYAKSTDTSWIIETVDDNGYLYAVDMAIDSLDNAHFIYWDGNSHELRYVKKEDGNWNTQIVDYYGDKPSITLDQLDNVHISYRKVTVDTGLRYATNKTGDWIIQTVDSNACIYTSIATDSLDNVHIGYYDQVNEDLKYATNVSGFWEIATIDTYLNVGAYVFIGIDSQDNVHMGYYNDSLDILKYATNSSGHWATETVDSEDWVWLGAYTNIAVDLVDNIHISYLDSTNHNLKYAAQLCPTLSARIDLSLPVYYASLQNAYDDALHGNIIQSQASSFSEDVYMNIDKSVILQGGHNCTYSTVTGKTTLRGNMTIVDGTVTIENLQLR